jgi:hypothetical protein
VHYWDGGEELYDLTRSRWQEENLVHNPRYTVVLDRMRTLDRELRSCKGAAQCNPPSQVPPSPRPQDRPRFTVTLDQRVAPASGSRGFRIHVVVAARSVPVSTGTVRLLVDGNAVGARVAVDGRGSGTLRWNPPPSARGTHHLSVRYDGADLDVTAGDLGDSVKVRVR